ncbi:MAG: DUF1003 domain-containing protein [Meiothermus sp.]
MLSSLLEPTEDNPAISRVIDRNTRTLYRLRLQNERRRSLQDRAADVRTNFSGRMLFVYLHLVWFIAWFLLNTGRFGLKPFDPFPYGLLTLIVSLESIFLSTFLLISQNRMAEISEKRSAPSPTPRTSFWRPSSGLPLYRAVPTDGSRAEASENRVPRP